MRRLGLLLILTLVAGGCGAEPVGGLEWERIDAPAFGERWMSDDGDRNQLQMSSVASNGSLLVAVGSEGSFERDAAVWVSTDGRQWEQVEVPAPADPYLRERMLQVVSVESGFVARGYVESIHDSVLWVSPDGYSWRRIAASVLGDPEDAAEIEAMVAGGPGVVAVGSTWHPGLGDRIGAIWVSTNGRTWERVAHDDDLLGDRGDFTLTSENSWPPSTAVWWRWAVSTVR